MRRIGSMVALAAASLAIAPGPSVGEGPAVLHDEQPARRFRGRGVQAKPTKRPNMRHISKRVRRKHRKAA